MMLVNPPPDSPLTMMCDDCLQKVIPGYTRMLRDTHMVSCDICDADA